MCFPPVARCAAQEDAAPAPEPTEGEKAAAAAKEAALKEKELGNEAYKKKQFEAAVQHYNK